MIDEDVSIPPWELNTGFDPIAAVKCRCTGPGWLDWTWVAMPTLSPMGAPSGVTLYPAFDSSLHVEKLAFRDPDWFVAGQLHDHVHVRGELLNEGSGQHMRVLDWIQQGDRVEDYFLPLQVYLYGSII